MFSIRLAVHGDIDPIYGFHQVAQREGPRRDVITRSIGAGACWVIVIDEQVVGYAVLEYSFFEHGFISLLYIHPDYRRRGAGLRLMQHLETVCQTEKLFTSTNLSNVPMQALLAKLDYLLSGVLHHLDEGDPELIYVKYVQ
ncbi:MAG: GNAT family N-acetyltransferase [Anaerolineae bacterium]|nr:GNAT family N-acetyltransferase [Anaerolineae bacterium]